MTHIYARALIGPNLFTPGPAAVAEVEPSQLVEGLEEAILREHRALSCALGWAPVDLLLRPYTRTDGGPGLSLAAPSPVDRIEAAAVLLERAIRRALNISESSITADLEAIRAEEEDERRSPELRALVEAAQARGVPDLIDEDALTLGQGVRGKTWPIGQLPIPAEIPWDSLGTVPIALITGTNGKTTSTRLLARIARHAGFCVGNTSTDGVVVDEALIEPGDWTGPGATRMVLRRQDVDFAALEIARGGLLRRGLVLDRVDAALITNISDDHLGDYGITDLQAMAQVKAIVGSVVHADGRVVMGADSAPLRTVDTARLRAPIVWFALRRDNPTLRSHIAGGGEGWYVADGELVRADKLGERPLIEVAEIPCTIGGAARHNLLNALGVAALAHSLGIPDRAICDGLRSFRSTAEENPGRINCYSLNGVTIVLDFAHNNAGIVALGEVLQALRKDGRLTVAFGMAGDRSEDDLRQLSRSLAGLRPDEVLLRDQKAHLRGRARGEVPAILRRGLSEEGLPQAALIDVDDEIESIDRTLALAEPGDLLAILAHTQRGEVIAHLDKLGAQPL